MLIRPLSLLVGCLLASPLVTPVASAEPGGEPVAVETSSADADAPAEEGVVVSLPPVTTTGPDGWTLTLEATKETHRPVPPLTTALSTREYEVGGTYTASMTGPAEDEPPRGVLEVGYQIGCGIDMSTSNGVALTGTAGINPSIGILGVDLIGPFPDAILPGVAGNLGGGITIGLKPGLINIVTVTEKEFTGADPWVMIDGFRIKIDGCVGESFIRSYALLTRSTDVSDAVLAYYGETTKV